MKVLIVHAHNEPRSFNSAMKDVAVGELWSQGHEVRISDLYTMNWNPVASAADFGSRNNSKYLVYALEQRHNFESGTLAPDIAAEIEKVQWADFIIFNFPIYWYGMPAIMKGWIDRVFISGLFYGGRRIYDRGGLLGKRAMLAFSLGGQEHMFGPDAIHGELDLLLRPIQRGMLAYVGLTVLPPFIAWHVPYLSDEERSNILEEYRFRISILETLTPFPSPSLDSFDENFRPLRVGN